MASESLTGCSTGTFWASANRLTAGMLCSRPRPEGESGLVTTPAMCQPSANKRINEGTLNASVPKNTSLSLVGGWLMKQSPYWR
jgi:hypothetical protein